MFLWNLFEGVPKFYRDAYEQGVLHADRVQLLERMFFESSSPLRSEADNWFLRELRGRYDTVLQFLARRPGSTNSDMEAALGEVSGPGELKQVSGYLKHLSEKYGMVERRLPILAPARARSGRYYIRDNFLRAWLSALQKPVSAAAFRPLATSIAQADLLLTEVEGHALEDLAAQLYEERSRRGLGDFPLSARIQGYWDRSDVEIDLVALCEEERRIRFASCKRNPEKLGISIQALKLNAARFLQQHGRYAGWRVEFAAIAPQIDSGTRNALAGAGVSAQSLADLTAGL